MIPFFSDTTHIKDGGTTSWEAMYNLLEEEKPRPLEMKATTNVEESFDASYFEETCSFLKKIASRPKILPYTYMVKCVTYNINVSDITFRNARHEVMGFFTLDSLRQMYHLPKPQNLSKKDFLEHFSKENEDPLDVT